MNRISMPLPANIKIDRPVLVSLFSKEPCVLSEGGLMPPVWYKGTEGKVHHLGSPLEPMVEVKMRTFGFYFYMVCFGL